jgi:NitT/TauT family transport system ATP-binding protein
MPGEMPALDDAPSGTRISFRGVTCRFVGKAGVVHALGPVDLDIADGEFLCVIGPSGCGKSTLLRMISGLSRPSDGSVDLLASDPRRATATVFQDYSIYPWKSVLANARFGLDLAGVSRSKGEARAMDYLERLGLADRAHARVGDLSGGMKQRVAIARALAVEPDILLMDEPFSAIDAQMRSVLQDELLRLWQSDRRTVVFVTHSIEEAILLGDRIVMLSSRPGHIVLDRRVPIERPRVAADIRNSAAFIELHDELTDALKTEVLDNLAAVTGVVDR